MSPSPASARSSRTRLNVLISSGGRRNYLVTWFREALQLTGLEGTVIVADADPNAPARAAADHACELPAIASPEYDDALLALCRDEAVDLALSLNDHELSRWARLDRTPFTDLGVTLVALPDEAQALVEDKLLMASRLSQAGLRVPATHTAQAVLSGEVPRAYLGERIIIKSRYGSGSSGLVVSSPSTLMADVARSAMRATDRLGAAVGGPEEGEACVVVQQHIEGVEYGVDLVNDMTGTFATVLVRKKLRMRGGETDQAVSESAGRFVRLGETLSSLLGHPGLVDCDVIEDAEGRQWVIDINPRFGGGYPFSHVAGADIPAAYAAWMSGRVPDPSWLESRPGVVSAKHIAIETVHDNA